jgi:plastocyanin
VLAAVSTQNQLLLGGMAAIFIVFALVSALLVPRTRPEFPGKRRNAFLGGTVLLFVAMLLAVEFFAVEEEEAHAGEAGSTVEVAGTEFELDPAETELSPGTYDFELVNEGNVGHNLVVNGPGVENQGTPVIEAGEKATLQVALVEGEYELYCSVAGHRDAGMEETITVR